MIKKLFLLVLLTVSAMNLNAQVTSVALVGEAAGGWPGSPGNPGPTDVHQMSSTDGENWTLNAITLTTFATDGGIKFRANNDWAINWGSAAFPDGTGTQGGANIQCIAGTYDVTFNSTTGAYSFIGGTPLPVVKLVGTAVTTPGGLVLNVTGPDTFSVSNSTLVAGDAQFEVDGVLYGGTTFPTGSALSDTDLIPVPAAFFSSISINLATGDYTFVLIPPVSIVGDGVGGWPPFTGNDPNQLSSSDGINYSLDKLACIVGPAKFRQDNAWAINWGNGAFPTGTATQGGDNISITTAGTYDVRFNRVTGEYSFSIPTIALVGEATPTGWPSGGPGEIDASALTSTDGVTYTLSNVTLTAGPCKFRANNAWAVNWGSAAFPIGTGTQGGDNILVTVAGTYNVTFNRVTGEYAFELTSGGFPQIEALGAFSADGVNAVTTDGADYKIDDYYFAEANGLRFALANDNTTFWGNTAFPSGTATLGGGDIPVPVGNFNVLFNSTTLAYDFTVTPISITGSGSTGWGNDVYLTSTDNGINFTGSNIVLVDGEIKFRSNSNYTKAWGATDFPTGTASLTEGANIQVTAGTYDVTFNRVTGAFNFQDVLSVNQFTNNMFKVFPNPSNNVWNFASKSNVMDTVTISDISGKTIYSQNVNALEFAVNAASFSNGLYFATVTSGQNTATYKLVKN